MKYLLIDESMAEYILLGINSSETEYGKRDPPDYRVIRRIFKIYPRFIEQYPEWFEELKELDAQGKLKKI